MIVRCILNTVDAQNQLRHLTRKAAKIFEKCIAKKCKNSAKKFWKYVSSKTKANNNIPDLYIDDDCDPNDMAKRMRKEQNL